MSKLSLLLLLGVMCCALEKALSNNFFYYPNSQGALSYQYQQPFSPYVYSAYAIPVDCDKTTTEGGGSSSSESSSSESSSSESSEGGASTEGSSSESSTEEKKEGEGSSSEEEGGKKDEGADKKDEGADKKEDSKKKVQQYVFPPVTYRFPPQTAQQVVYSAPGSYSYMPYNTYPVFQQPSTYAVKSSGYSNYPSYSLSSVPFSAPVSARVVSGPVNKVISPASYTYPGLSKTISFSPASGVGGPSGYWNGNVGYYRA